MKEIFLGTVGLEIGRERNRYIEEEVRGAIKLLKNGKTGEKGVVSKVVKSRCETAMEWIWKVCLEARESSQVPDDWTKAVIFPLYKGNGSKVIVRITWE